MPEDIEGRAAPQLPAKRTAAIGRRRKPPPAAFGKAECGAPRRCADYAARANGGVSESAKRKGKLKAANAGLIAKKAKMLLSRQERAALCGRLLKGLVSRFAPRSALLAPSSATAAAFPTPAYSPLRKTPRPIQSAFEALRASPCGGCAAAWRPTPPTSPHKSGAQLFAARRLFPVKKIIPR